MSEICAKDRALQVAQERHREEALERYGQHAKHIVLQLHGHDYVQTDGSYLILYIISSSTASAYLPINLDKNVTFHCSSLAALLMAFNVGRSIEHSTINPSPKVDTYTYIYTYKISHEQSLTNHIDNQPYLLGYTYIVYISIYEYTSIAKSPFINSPQKTGRSIEHSTINPSPQN